MKFLFFVVLSVVSAEDVGNNWETFKATHGKEYTASTEVFRAKIFALEDKKIQEHNLANSDYKRAHNMFSDLTTEERNQYLGIQTPGNLSVILRSSTKFSLTRQDLPDTLDYRTHECMPAVKSQGGCGSCWAFTSITPLEFSNCMKHGNTLSILSEQQLVDCDYNNGGCGGGWYTSAWDYLKNDGGCARDDLYQYVATQDSCRFCPRMSGAQVESFDYVESYNVEAMQTALQEYGPLAVAIAVIDSFFTYSSGVYTDPECDGVGVNHGVVVVGYGTLDGIDYWVIRNSWSTGWGAEGYALMQRGVNKCRIEAAPAYVVAV